MARGGRGIRACIIITRIILFSIGPAAADPIVTVSGTVSESYNDNVGLAPAGARQARDWITALTPQIGISDQGRRVQFNLTYSPTELIFAGDTPFTTLQQNLLSSGQAELIRDTFFVKEQAAIIPQFINGIGAVGPTTYTTNSNLQTIEEYTFSPILRHHFGDITDAETRFSYGRLIASENGLAPLQSQELRQTFTSGTYFGRLGWTLLGDATRDVIGTAPGAIIASGVLKDDLARADLRYVVLRPLSVTASAGYEEISFPRPTLAPSLSFPMSIRGPIWNAGFAYTPNPSFSLSATYGSRYGAPDYEVSAKYSTALTTATLTYSETIETTSMLLLSNLGGLGFSNGLAVNSTTGLPFAGNGGFGNIPALPFNATDSAFLGKFLNASLETTRGRNSFTAYASYGIEHIFAAPAITEPFYTASFGWGRNLWPRLTSHLSATYSYANFGRSGEYQRIYSALGSLAYTLSPRSAVTFSLAISKEQSNVSSIAISDDIASVAYTRRF